MAPTIKIQRYKMWNAELWIEAQKKFHHGNCLGFWHNLFYRKTKQINSKQKADGSSASLFVCTKCNGIKEAYVTIKMEI